MIATIALALGGLTALAAAQTCGDITQPASVAAGTAFTVGVKNNLTDCEYDAGGDYPSVYGSGSSYSNEYNNYRVYLATDPTGQTGATAVCYFVNSTSASSTSISVTIPADLGPSGNFYSIAIMPYFIPGNQPSGGAYSSTDDLEPYFGDIVYGSSFSLTGGTSQWSNYEYDETELWTADNLPCTAYNCARQCAVQYYPQDEQGEHAFDKMSSCILQCSGVTPEDSDEGYGGDYCNDPDEDCYCDYNDDDDLCGGYGSYPYASSTVWGQVPTGTTTAFGTRPTGTAGTTNTSPAPTHQTTNAAVRLGSGVAALAGVAGAVVALA